MVGFRKVTAGMPVTDWQAFGDEVISFGRGDKGHLVMKIGAETVNGTFITRMSPGEYCNVLLGPTTENNCVGPVVRIDDDGVLQLAVAPMSAVAIHSAAIK
jgi:alpha-amylase